MQFEIKGSWKISNECSMAFWEWEHAMMRKIYESRTIHILLLIFLDQFVKVDSLVSNILWALLVWFKTKSVTTFVHIHGTKTKAENIKLTRLPRTLSIALSIDKLFILCTFLYNVQPWSYTDSIMINCTVWANWGTNITLSDYKAWRADWEPFTFANLTVVASLLLPISSP